MQIDDKPYKNTFKTEKIIFHDFFKPVALYLCEPI